MIIKNMERDRYASIIHQQLRLLDEDLSGIKIAGINYHVVLIQ